MVIFHTPFPTGTFFCIILVAVYVCEIDELKASDTMIDLRHQQSLMTSESSLQSRTESLLESNSTVKPASHPLIGKKLPNLTLITMNNQVERLSRYRGKVILIHFWATWCPPCRSEFKSLQNLYKRMNGKQFNILAISHDVVKEEVKLFFQRRNVDFPIYFDPYTTINYEIFNQVTALPITLLVNPFGVVERIYWGPQKWDEDVSILMEIDKLFAEQ